MKLLLHLPYCAVWRGLCSPMGQRSLHVDCMTAGVTGALPMAACNRCRSYLFLPPCLRDTAGGPKKGGSQGLLSTGPLSGALLRKLQHSAHLHSRATLRRGRAPAEEHCRSLQGGKSSPTDVLCAVRAQG